MSRILSLGAKNPSSIKSDTKNVSVLLTVRTHYNKWLDNFAFFSEPEEALFKQQNFLQTKS